jgi:quercetin dioxygenase-like cupin family protein
VSAFGDVGSSEPLQIWDGVAAWTVEGDRVTLALIELEPNSVVPEHSHENEQVGVLLRGSMTFRIGDEERELRPGETWRILSRVPHGVSVGPDGATLVEVFAPLRADWGALERVAGRRPVWPELP